MSDTVPNDTASEGTAQPYRVLARKYRPTTFEDLIGQEPMVQTLSNAIASGRLAHAFVLTGVRGVGKTTTARIIARALNCVGPDGTGGPTITPCGVCDNCVAIAEDRHVDVMEMDAASRTGVDDIRELIDGVRYRPVQARFKIYIIDEVHMLSKNAFNALLKTLEEPPEHVKFLFATTEIRRVPITVLSRCQRFDLRRIEFETLVAHLKRICDKEGASVAEEGLYAIARAAEGSVRDSLSMLDQAIASGGSSDAVTADQVRDMLGLADRGRTADLFEAVLAGNVEKALTDLRDQYNTGADPLVTLSDLLEYSHLLTRMRAAPQASEAAGDDMDMDRAKEMAGKLDMPSLTRAWQVLLKGLEEARMAPSAIAAVEMTLIRLAHASNLPSPAELIKQIQGQANNVPPSPPAPGGGVSGGGGASMARSAAPGGGVVHITAAPEAVSQPDTILRSMEDVVALARENKEHRLAFSIKDDMHVVSFNGGRARMEVRLTDKAPRELVSELTTKLRKWTGHQWVISIAQAGGEDTIHQKEEAAQAALLAQAADHPLVANVLSLFPGSKIDYVERRDAFTTFTVGDAIDSDSTDAPLDTLEAGLDADDPFAYSDYEE